MGNKNLLNYKSIMYLNVYNRNHLVTLLKYVINTLKKHKLNKKNTDLKKFNDVLINKKIKSIRSETFSIMHTQIETLGLIENFNSEFNKRTLKITKKKTQIQKKK